MNSTGRHSSVLRIWARTALPKSILSAIVVVSKKSSLFALRVVVAPQPRRIMAPHLTYILPPHAVGVRAESSAENVNSLPSHPISTVEPGPYRPSRRADAIGLEIRCWINRFRGRAP